MAATVHMKITKASDNKQITGETSQSGDSFFKGMIECTYFEQSITTPFESGNNVEAVSNRTHSPVTTRKRVDHATPTLRELMRLTEPLNVEFIFHRPGRKKTGDHHFFGVLLEGAKIASIRLVSPDAYLDEDNESLVPYEEIQFTFASIKVSYFHEENNAAVESHDHHHKSWQHGA